LKNYVALATAILQFAVAVIRAWLAAPSRKAVVEDQIKLAKSLKDAMVKVKESGGDTSAIEEIINAS